jgi:hypothetical protein
MVGMRDESCSRVEVSMVGFWRWEVGGGRWEEKKMKRWGERWRFRC